MMGKDRREEEGQDQRRAREEREEVSLNIFAKFMPITPFMVVSLSK
jgi:hypothetical protein